MSPYVPRGAAVGQQQRGRPKKPAVYEFVEILRQTVVTGDAYSEDVSELTDAERRVLRREMQRAAREIGVKLMISFTSGVVTVFGVSDG